MSKISLSNILRSVGLAAGVSTLILSLMQVLNIETGITLLSVSISSVSIAELLSN